MGITSEQLAAFDAECLRSTDLVKESRVSDETALMLDVDKKRDSLVVYLTTSISQMRNRSITVQATVALSLYNVTNPYVGIYRSANQQETQPIFGLFSDLDKPESAASLFVRNLNLLVDETTALYNLRIRASKAGKKPGNDRSDII